MIGYRYDTPLAEVLWSPEVRQAHREASMPMSARGWATEIMEALRLPIVAPNGFTVQDVLTGMVEAIMDQVDADKAQQYRDVQMKG
jgi:hypothetical protein